MDKKSLITLIYRDLYELKVLTSGFSEMKIFPKILVDLAVDKAENLANCLKKLPLNVDESQAYLDFAKTDSQDVETQKVEEKIEIIEKPKTEEKFKAEILNEQEKVEEQIAVEQKSKIVAQQPKIEEKIEPQIKEEIKPIIEVKVEPTIKKVEPKTEISVAKPILQNKVLDLKQAVSIADRFRFQRELFDGNGEKFSKALSDFNEMETLEQAQDYIVQNLKLDLELPVVQTFVEILKKKLN